MWDLFVVEYLHETVAGFGVGQGEFNNSIAPFQQQDVENAAFELSLHYNPTGEVGVVHIPSLLAEKLGDAFVAEADFGGVNGPNGFKPVKRSEEQCDRNDKP